MESKHFSHNHSLAFHQVPQGSEIQCSACKSPGSGNVYSCWQCSYFLHDQCFRASRSLNHHSHPLHPLTLVPFPTYPSGSFFCNTCTHAGDGFSYSCSACEFDIHLHCALTPNPNPNPNPNPHVYPSPLPAPNFNSQPQNPTYPPPIQTTDFQSYPPPNTNPNPNPFQNYPPQPTGYPPVPNSPFPNVNPAFQHHPPPSFPQPNPPPPQNFSPPTNFPATTTPPPNPTLPTYSTVVNTTTLNPPTPPPPSNPPSMIKHFSHPHVLNSTEIKENTGKVCSACEWEISGSSYCCTEPNCTFALDKACFDAPRELHHKSHPHHSLTLMTGGTFDCYACWKSGKGLSYTCIPCSFVIHIDCVDWPETAPSGGSHKHEMTLCYSPAGENVNIPCYACEDPVDQKAWRYYCSECGVGVHTGCCFNSVAETQDDIPTRLFKIHQMQMHTNFILQMSNQNAKFMASINNSWKNF